MKNTGIWIDKKQALIVTFLNNEASLKIVHSEIDTYNITANRHKGGPKEIVKDIKYLEREKHQFKTYFKDITNELNDTDALVIFGPAETFEKFVKELEQHHKHLSAKIKGIRRADSMTENQVVAWVGDFFESN
jgi:stalled ribosome rescue protein Dom34